MRLARRAGTALLLVGLGALLSPAAVPVYDGLGAPDEPYRYVATPEGEARTAEPTTAAASSPVVAGRSSYGMTVASEEKGPQVSLFLPPKALATTAGTVRVAVTPLAPADQPAQARIDGNVYEVRFEATAPVTLTPQAAIAQISLRATSARQPGPVVEHRTSSGQPWVALATTRGGQDFYVAAFREPGQYALAFLPTEGDTGSSPLPLLLLGGAVLLVAVVVVIRLRAAR